MYQNINLNGNWQLQPGAKKPGNFNYTVPVPAMVDNCKPSFNWQDNDYFWYKKEIHLKTTQITENAWLQLEQVQFGTEVWLNGKQVGGDIPCYTSQWFDLNEYIRVGNNTLLVRVGQKHTLPKHSAVGNDQERLAWIPGIWGDVQLHLYGQGRVRWLRVLPDIDTDRLNLRFEIENFTASKLSFTLEWQIIEKKSQDNLTSVFRQKINIDAGVVASSKNDIAVTNYKLWLPESPSLYTVAFKLFDTAGRVVHKGETDFGFRKFEIRDGHFYLNNQRKVLLGSNIAFHRLLNDSTRGTLLWDEAWIKKALIDIPKENNLSFFRFHLGHAYNRWYDLADEYGIMLEDEWGFWESGGSPTQIEKEFMAWIRENCNRPSIVIWNALNESSDEVITQEIIPRMKKLDPTRPWQHVDFNEDHPYIYSLGPVLNGKKFGFSRSIFDLQKSESPSMVNEFEWWWLDRENNPSKLTEIIVERWLGRNPTKEMLLDHQAFLAAELGELWRRLDLDAIMPFVYLSVGEGATANWFDGPLKKLKPKPVLIAYKNAFSPIGVSLELWDRHLVCGEKRDINIFLFNDRPSNEDVSLCVYNKNQPETIFFNQQFPLLAGAREIVPFNWDVPFKPGSFLLRAEIKSANGKILAFSEKQVHVFDKIEKPDCIPTLAIADPSREISDFLESHKITFKYYQQSLEGVDCVLFNLDSIELIDKGLRKSLTKFVQDGGRLIFQETEFSIKNEKHFKVLNDLKLKITPQDDSEMGGYNSYVFVEDIQHPMWEGIETEHLKMFNGALGGEMVSAYDVVPCRDFKTHARCGLSLATPAVMEIPYGKGKVIISRIQIRGRLNKTRQGDLFNRRYDPVAEHYFWNLIK